MGGDRDVGREAEAAERDRLAAARDTAADRRDVSAEERETDSRLEDAERGRIGSTRRSYRRGASHDREAAADDRKSAATDRECAARDREAAARQIRALMHDDLTGFQQRGAGLIEIEREVVKAHRTREPFTVVFVDVDDLKGVNDSAGHAAGDHLIVRVAAAIRSLLREYDVVTRYGGDEFLCGLQGLREDTARRRFTRLNEILGRGGAGTASVGVAELRPGETVHHLIDRADQDMYARKRSGRRHVLRLE